LPAGPPFTVVHYRDQKVKLLSTDLQIRPTHTYRRVRCGSIQTLTCTTSTKYSCPESKITSNSISNVLDIIIKVEV